MLVNLGDGRFVEAATPFGLASLSDGRGLALSDFDGDGDVDVIINNYNDVPHYFVNRAARGHWLRVRCRGRQSNRDAIGAKISVTTGDRRQLRVVTAGQGYGSQYSRVVHFGLADATRIDELQITWPSGQRQVLRDIAVDRIIDVEENAEFEESAAVVHSSGDEGSSR